MLDPYLTKQSLETVDNSANKLDHIENVDSNECSFSITVMHNKTIITNSRYNFSYSLTIKVVPISVTWNYNLYLAIFSKILGNSTF